MKLIRLEAQRSACFLWKIGSFELTGKFISVISLKVNSLRINYDLWPDGVFEMFFIVREAFARE